MSILSFCSAVVSRIRRHTRTRCGSVAVWCTVVHMGGWTSVVGCRAVMLLGPRLPSFSLFLSFTAISLLSSFSPSSRFIRCPSSSSYHLATSFLSLSLLCIFLFLSLSPFPFSSSRRTRGPRVSRQALWWLLRWLLASLESSQESVPPPRVKELPREQVHLLLCLSPPLLLSPSPFLSLRRATLPTRPMPPPVRTLGFYLFSLITAVGM